MTATAHPTTADERRDDRAETEARRPRRLAQLAQLPVETLRGVGGRRAQALRAMGIESVLDLLTHYPRRYADRTNCVAIAELVVGEEAVVAGRVTKVTTRRPRNRRPIVELVVADETGKFSCSFFNQPWRARQLVVDRDVVVFGRVDTYREAPHMTNPVVDLAGDRTGRVIPVYPQSGKAGVTSVELGTYVAEALERAGEFADPLSAKERRALGLIGRTSAFSAIHAPDALHDDLPARRRLAFDELLRLQVALVMRKRAVAAQARGIRHDARPIEPDANLVATFLSSLPFALTGAQRGAIGEILDDLADDAPMHRLLQGDVGSGKTVVALAAALTGVQGGFQAAFMVPTEVLAEQHYLVAGRLLAHLEVPDGARLGGRRPIEVALLTSRTTERERRTLLRKLARGEIDLLVGTHALLTDDVEFAALGVVVIDEQHRFGVDQRATLREKGASGRDPDVLVMTATPIPRTVAMTVYGDLDTSELDEMPAGRAPVATGWVAGDEQATRVWNKVRSELNAGHKVYVICPLVHAGDEADDGAAGEPGAAEQDPAVARGGFEQTEGDGGRLFVDTEAPIARRAARGAIEEFERLGATELAGARLGLLHGQLAAREKERVMAAFRRGELRVLVATTVIEVGVDVPDATVVVIEDADRFGLAQLHQLRGRVGRGDLPSWCFLLTGEVTDDAARRLEALVATTDGFELAEVDLDLRGEGTVLGVRQKGRSDLKLASLRRHRELVRQARSVADTLVRADERLERHGVLAEELRLFIDDEEAAYLFRS